VGCSRVSRSPPPRAPIIVVDTNVIAAGLITPRLESKVALVLDGMSTARFSYAVSEASLAEYLTVLARPKLRKLHGLDDVIRLLQKRPLHFYQ
jgi:predicted nucleic acid-binding protein